MTPRDLSRSQRVWAEMSRNPQVTTSTTVRTVQRSAMCLPSSMGMPRSQVRKLGTVMMSAPRTKMHREDPQVTASLCSNPLHRYLQREAMAGVLAVSTGEDAPDPFGVLPVTKDEHAMAVEKVRHVGDLVACVRGKWMNQRPSKRSVRLSSTTR